MRTRIIPLGKHQVIRVISFGNREPLMFALNFRNCKLQYLYIIASTLKGITHRICTLWLIDQIPPTRFCTLLVDDPFMRFSSAEWILNFPSAAGLGGSFVYTYCSSLCSTAVCLMVMILVGWLASCLLAYSGENGKL